MAFASSLALGPTFGIYSHKTLDTAQPCHLLKPNSFALTNISTQFLLQSLCLCVCVCVAHMYDTDCVCVWQACMMYDTDPCHTHLNLLWCVCVEGGVCLSVWCFVWVVWAELCSTCVLNIIFGLLCIM